MSHARQQFIGLSASFARQSGQNSPWLGLSSRSSACRLDFGQCGQSVDECQTGVPHLRR